MPNSAIKHRPDAKLLELITVEKDEFMLLDEAREILDSENKNSKYSDDQLVCECLCITAGDIRSVLKGNVVNLETLSFELKLGSGCSSCKKSFQQWKDRI
jgi:NAD(P)H-nitrite reductase large subunit